MISKSGYPLLAPEACATLVQELLPLATLVTPNLPGSRSYQRYEGDDEGRNATCLPNVF